MPNIALIIEEQKLTLEKEVAVVDMVSKDNITYGQLATKVAALSKYIRETLKNSQDNKLAILMPNSIDWIVAYYSILATGNIVVSLNQNWPEELIETVVNKLDLKFIFTNSEYSKKLNQKRKIVEVDKLIGLDFESDLIIEDKQYNDLATIQFTSGTTNIPKAVALSHLNVIYNRKMATFYCGIHPEDKIFCFLPFYHCYGQNVIFNASIFCGSTLYLDNIKLSDPDGIFAKLEDSKANTLFGIPAVYDLLLSDPAKVKKCLENFRYFLCGADYLSATTEKKWYENTGKHLYQAYGKTELSPLHTSSQYFLWKANSVGKAIKGCNTKILNIENNKIESEPFQKGEVLTSGHNTSLGYIKDGKIAACSDELGYHHTNDTGYLDEDGYLYLIGRTDDMFTINGENIYPQEIENVVKREDPALVVVAGSIEIDNVKKVILCIETKAENDEPSHQENENYLSQVFKQKLPPNKIPKRFFWISNFPRTSSGKIIRKQLIESIQSQFKN